jgi:arylsulfatase A-like enzyme
MEWYGWKIPVVRNQDYSESLANIPERWMSNQSKELFTKFGRLDLSPEDTFDYRIASKCADAILTAKEPFMLTCSFNMPHDPNVAPSPYYKNVDMSHIKADASLYCDAAYLGDLSKDIPAHAGDAFLTEFLRVYHAGLKLVDDQIGRLFEALEQRGITGSTVVIFTADHGDMAGGHGMFWKSTRAFYEEVARVPLIISAPGHNKNARYSKPVESVDIMPTILGLCGVKTPENTDGANLAPALSGGESGKNTALCERLGFGPGNIRYRHTNDRNYNFMLRAGKFKYIIHHTDNSGNPEDARLLFDLENDPKEYENLCNRPGFEAKTAEMHSLLQKRLSESGYEL